MSRHCDSFVGATEDPGVVTNVVGAAKVRATVCRRYAQMGALRAVTRVTERCDPRSHQCSFDHRCTTDIPWFLSWRAQPRPTPRGWLHRHYAEASG